MNFSRIFAISPLAVFLIWPGTTLASPSKEAVCLDEKTHYVNGCALDSFIRRGAELGPCPGDPPCASETHRCPDGRLVARNPGNSCRFFPCNALPQSCPQDDDVRLITCWDGSVRTRDPRNKCELVPCPSEPPSNAPSLAPSSVPSASPSTAPSASPTTSPSSSPSTSLSTSPSTSPSAAPSSMPTYFPSSSPSFSVVPSSQPSTSSIPTDIFCPCFDASDLEQITSDNRYHCYEADSDSRFTSITGGVNLEGHTIDFEFGTARRIAFSSHCIGSSGQMIAVTVAQYDICKELILNRCAEVGLDVRSTKCPCWDADDLKAVTADNVESCRSWSHFGGAGGEALTDGTEADDVEGGFFVELGYIHAAHSCSTRDFLAVAEKDH